MGSSFFCQILYYFPLSLSLYGRTLHSLPILIFQPKIITLSLFRIDAETKVSFEKLKLLCIIPRDSTTTDARCEANIVA